MELMRVLHIFTNTSALDWEIFSSDRAILNKIFNANSFVCWKAGDTRVNISFLKWWSGTIWKYFKTSQHNWKNLVCVCKPRFDIECVDVIGAFLVVLTIHKGEKSIIIIYLQAS